MYKRVKIYLALCLCSAFILTACGSTGKEPVTLQSEFCDVTADTNAAYIKSYLMMDCCRQYKEMKNYIQELYEDGDVTSAEGFEFYFYNDNGGRVTTETDMDVVYRPTDEFNSKEGEIACYDFKTQTMLDCTVDGNTIKFHTNKPGIYIVTKLRDADADNLWVSNAGCTGQCQSCSDDW